MGNRFAIPLGRADFKRDSTKIPRIALRNRYFEEDPVLTEDQVSLPARPGMRYGLACGEGPIRHVKNFPGAFGDDLFVVSYLNLYRVNKSTLAVTDLGQIGTVVTDSVSMVATGNVGDIPEHLFVCDGGTLWCYTENGYATDFLEATGAIANNDTVVIDGIYYKWTNGSVDTGTPDGTSGAPWLVDLGATNAEALDNLFAAIGDTGTPGTTYSTALTPHTTVRGYNVSSTQLFVQALDAGIAGNGIAVSETGANIAWDGATLSGGGSPTLLQVPMPDDVGAISLGYIASHVIVVPAQGFGVNGRFYWIEPGEVTVDPLNYATAERSTDAIFQVVVFGDQFWLMGQDTTETWFFTGDPDAPVQRTQGITFDSGVWEGTAIQVGDGLIGVDPHGDVWLISGQKTKISTPDIAERLRDAMQLQRVLGF